MVKTLEHLKNATISLETIDGISYEMMDIPDKPLGDNEYLVSFWDTETSIMIIPMDQIKWCRFNF